MRFDLLIKGGEVVDPGAGYRGRLDVAIKRNRISGQWDRSRRHSSASTGIPIPSIRATATM